MNRIILAILACALLGWTAGCGEKEPDLPKKDPSGPNQRIPKTDKK